MTASDEQREAVLRRQLATNEETWRALREQGVTQDSELRLDFFFEAPDEASARALAALLGEETDYDVGVGTGSGRVGRARKWAVIGTTQTTKVSPPLLDEWVAWMVGAGFEHGCVFDGWGADAA